MVALFSALTCFVSEVDLLAHDQEEEPEGSLQTHVQPDMYSEIQTG